MNIGDTVYAVVKGDNYRLKVTPATVRIVNDKEIVLEENRSASKSSYTVWTFPAGAAHQEIFTTEDDAEKARKRIEFEQSGWKR